MPRLSSGTRCSSASPYLMLCQVRLGTQYGLKPSLLGERVNSTRYFPISASASSAKSISDVRSNIVAPNYGAIVDAKCISRYKIRILVAIRASKSECRIPVIYGKPRRRRRLRLRHIDRRCRRCFRLGVADSPDVFLDHAACVFRNPQ